MIDCIAERQSYAGCQSSFLGKRLGKPAALSLKCEKRGACLPSPEDLTGTARFQNWDHRAHGALGRCEVHKSGWDGQ